MLTQYKDKVPSQEDDNGYALAHAQFEDSFRSFAEKQLVKINTFYLGKFKKKRRHSKPKYSNYCSTPQQKKSTKLEGK